LRRGLSVRARRCRGDGCRRASARGTPAVVSPRPDRRSRIFRAGSAGRRIEAARVDRPATSGETDVSDRVYFDHAATTPVRPEAVAAMEPYHTSVGYNPSSLHAEGRRARAAVDRARETVAQALGARPGEIVFTGSGTEADNIAIFGVARARRERGKHIVSTTIEHHAVLHALDVLREDGWDVTLIDVDERGLVAPDRFRSALRPDTVLATVMLANNEIGTIEPIAELAAIARDRGVVLHTDAVQAPGKLSIATGDLGVD